MIYQSSHAPTERAFQSARRLEHSRYAAAGINSRKELIGAGLALVVVALVLWGVAVIVPEHGRLPGGTVQSSFGSSPASRVSPPDGASITIAKGEK